MGKDKAFLPDTCDGEGCLLDRAFATAEHLLRLLGLDGEEVYVSGSYPNHRCFSDLIPGLGPLSGMHAALAGMLKRGEAYQRLLFMPVDMPALTVPTLMRLVQNVSDARAMHYEGYELPAVIRVERDTVDLLKERLTLAPEDRTSLSVRDFLESVRALKIKPTTEQHREFVNVNTPADLEEWHTGKEARNEH